MLWLIVERQDYAVGMSEIVFNVHLDEDGGYWTRAENVGLHTQGDTWQELCDNVRDVVALYFRVLGEDRPAKVKLHLVHDQELQLVA